MEELWLVRHGESVGNVAATAADAARAETITLATRDADVPLSETHRPPQPPRVSPHPEPRCGSPEPPSCNT